MRFFLRSVSLGGSGGQPWTSRCPAPAPRKSKNSEGRRLATLRTQVSLEAGLGGPHKAGGSRLAPTNREGGGREGKPLDRFCQLCKTALVLNGPSISFLATSCHTVFIKMASSTPEDDERGSLRP